MFRLWIKQKKMHQTIAILFTSLFVGIAYSQTDSNGNPIFNSVTVAEKRFSDFSDNKIFIFCLLNRRSLQRGRFLH